MYLFQQGFLSCQKLQVWLKTTLQNILVGRFWMHGFVSTVHQICKRSLSFICCHSKFVFVPTLMQLCLIQAKDCPCSATLEYCTCYVHKYTGISVVSIWATFSNLDFWFWQLSCNLFIYLFIYIGYGCLGHGGWCSVNCCHCLIGTHS